MKDIITYIKESSNNEKFVGKLKDIKFSDLIGYLYIEDYKFNSSDVFKELGWSEEDYKELVQLKDISTDKPKNVSFDIFKELLNRKEPFDIVYVHLDKSKGIYGGEYTLTLSENYKDEDAEDVTIDRYEISELAWTEYNTIMKDFKNYKK